MSRPFRAAALGVIAVAGGCAAGWAGRSCLGAATCTTMTALGSHAAVVGALVAALTTLGVIALRATWLLAAAHRAVGRLARRPTPMPLRAAMSRNRLHCAVLCVRDDDALAFCAGVVRPHIVVTDTLVERLRPGELDAVLLHEAAHARRCDPVRHALRRAAAEVLFYMPVIGWWASRQLGEAELAADRVAIDRIGAAPLAGALTIVAEGAGRAHAVPAAVGLRVSQVLGDLRPRPRPSARDLAASIAGLGVAVMTGLCASQVFGA